MAMYAVHSGFAFALSHWSLSLIRRHGPSIDLCQKKNYYFMNAIMAKLSIPYNLMMSIPIFFVIC